METPQKSVTRDNGVLIFECPHCDLPVTVAENEVNCHIFRHGYFFQSENGKINLLSQVSPHLPKAECERLVREEKVVGCCKPFRLDGNVVTVCGYV